MNCAFLPQPDETALAERFAHVRHRLETAAAASGRSADEVTLVAVSKTHPPAAVAALAALWQKGTPVFGENYAQEAVEKQGAVCSLLLASSRWAALTPQWHFIGHLQSRKAREIAGRFSLIHTLDSEKLAAQLQKTVQAQQLPPQDVLVQINIGEEMQKSGVAPKDAEALITAVMPMSGVRILGLMCLPPLFGEAAISRPYFAKLRELRDKLAQTTGLALPHLSMGMSHDCEVAIAEGATMVRVGTDIFGTRPPKAKNNTP